MTRIAPRSADSGMIDGLVGRMLARWRVGAHGALEVAIDVAHRDGSRGRARAVVAFDEERIAVEGHVVVDGQGCEREIRFIANPSRRFTSGFSLTLCERSGADPVMVTDLPERLGLVGGTYAIDQCIFPLRSQA